MKKEKNKSMKIKSHYLECTHCGTRTNDLMGLIGGDIYNKHYKVDSEKIVGVETTRKATIPAGEKEKLFCPHCENKVSCPEEQNSE